MKKRLALFVAVTSLVLLAYFLGCSGSNQTPLQQPTTVNVTMSDPATCSGPQGIFDHVYVTVTDVEAHTSTSAGPNDNGWVDLTPNLKSGTPLQIDLLSAPDTTCVLARLGSVSQLQPGNYQQIRLFLLANSNASSIPQGQNNCASVNAANCVVLKTGTTAALQLPSQVQTGIKIPSGQIAGGQFTVPAGQTVDLNIEFNTCSSIVVQGNGYLLKPVLHAGELSTTATSIKGVIVDQNTKKPISGGKVIVALEKPEGSCSGAGCASSAPIDRIFMAVTADAAGNFTFCPVPEGIAFDVVAVATGASGNNPVAYAATVTTGVQAGTNLGTVPLIPQPTTTQNPSTAPATIKGTITSAPPTPNEVVTVSALQPFNSALFTLPLTQGAFTTLSLTTQSGTVDYTMPVPAQNANVGAFNPSGTSYTQDTTSAVKYIVDAEANGCTPSELQTGNLKAGGTLTVTAGVESDAATIAFTSCQ